MMVKVNDDSKLSFNRVIRKIWDEFVYSSHLVALGDALALYVLSLILNINITISFFIVVYLSILAINFFNRCKDIDQDNLTNPERSTSVSKYFKFMPYIMGFLFLVSVFITALCAPFNALIFMLFLFGLGIFYSIYLKSVTRKVIGFKNFMTALPYALLVIFLSLFYNTPIALSTILITIFYFIRIFVNTTFFDIKDIKSDKLEGLRTFPVVYGENKTKKILLALNIISALPIFIGIYFKVLPLYSIGILVTIFYVLIYLTNKKSYKQRVLYNVIVDGEFIFWPLYILICRGVLG
jgi:4-hydroxybenzoate polyprenyltransferase